MVCKVPRIPFGFHSDSGLITFSAIDFFWIVILPVDFLLGPFTASTNRSNTSGIAYTNE